MADETNALELMVEVVSSFMGKNHIRADDVPALLSSVHAAIKDIDRPESGPEPKNGIEIEHMPAVGVRKSLASPDHIISMIDGKPYRTLRRHLRGHGLTPEEYRQRYGLKSDYPMVAKTYSEARRLMAITIGLGRKTVAAVESAVGIAAAPEQENETRSAGRTKSAADGRPDAQLADKPKRGRPRKTPSAA